MEAEVIFHDRLSFFLNATAIYPPRRPGDGYDLLDILVIRPNGPPGRMLEPTLANLAHLPLALSEKRKLQAATQYSTYDDSEPRRFSDASSWTPEFSAALAATPAIGVSAARRSVKTHVVDMQIESETAERIAGDAGSLVEDIAMRHLHALLTRTALKSYLRRRFLFGIVIKVLHGTLSASIESTGARDQTINAAVAQQAEASVGASNSRSQGTSVVGEGVVGVHLLCFIAKFDNQECHVSAPIPLIRADSRDFTRARQWVRAGKWRVLGIPNVIPGRGVFKAVQVARSDDPRLTPEERERTAVVFSKTKGSMGVGDGQLLPASFGGLEGAHIWNRNAVADPRGRKAGDGDSDTVLISDFGVLNDSDLDSMLRWRQTHPLGQSILDDLPLACTS